MLELRLTIEVPSTVGAMHGVHESLSAADSAPVAQVRRLIGSDEGAWSAVEVVACIPCASLPDLRRKASQVGTDLYLRASRVSRFRILAPARTGMEFRLLECVTPVPGATEGPRKGLAELIGRARGAGSMVAASQLITPGKSVASALGRMDCSVVTRLRNGDRAALVSLARAALPDGVAPGAPMEVFLDSDVGADAGWDPCPEGRPYQFLRRVAELFPTWEASGEEGQVP